MSDFSHLNCRCLEIISKGPGRVLVVGLLLCLAAPLMAIMSKMVDRFHQDGEHAHANDPRKNSAEISALFSVAFDSARLFAGKPSTQYHSSDLLAPNEPLYGTMQSLYNDSLLQC